MNKTPALESTFIRLGYAWPKKYIKNVLKRMMHLIIMLRHINYFAIVFMVLFRLPYYKYIFNEKEVIHE